MITRGELIKSDEFWEEIIETILLPENHSRAVKYVLDLKNELLALPIEVPTEEQIENVRSAIIVDFCFLSEDELILHNQGFKAGIKWAIKEILKRNK